MDRTQKLQEAEEVTQGADRSRVSSTAQASRGASQRELRAYERIGPRAGIGRPIAYTEKTLITERASTQAGDIT